MLNEEIFFLFKLAKTEDALKILQASMRVLERRIEFAWRADTKCQNKNSFFYQLCVELHASRNETSYNEIKNFYEKYGLHEFISDIQRNGRAVPTVEDLDDEMKGRVLARRIGADPPLPDLT